MSKYKEETATGSTWIRCKGVMIQNHLTSPPVCYFDESRVTEVNGNTSEQSIGSITKQFSPSEEIVLLNPETGDPTGETVTQGHLYQILYSLYMNAAGERDANIAAMAAEHAAMIALASAAPSAPDSPTPPDANSPSGTTTTEEATV